MFINWSTGRQWIVDQLIENPRFNSTVISDTCLNTVSSLLVNPLEFITPSLRHKPTICLTKFSNSSQITSAIFNQITAPRKNHTSWSCECLDFMLGCRLADTLRNTSCISNDIISNNYWVENVKVEKTEIIRVLVIEENRLVGEGLRQLLGGLERIDITIEIKDPLVSLGDICTYKPDVLLLRPPEFNNRLKDFLKQLRLTSPEIKPLLYAISLSNEQLLQLAHLGIRGYLADETDTALLENAINCIVRGEYWMNRQITARLISSTLFSHTNSPDTPIRQRVHLTTREKEVLSLLAKGLKNTEIASQLYISSATVKSHLNRIFKKIGVSNRYEAILYSLAPKPTQLSLIDTGTEAHLEEPT